MIDLLRHYIGLVITGKLTVSFAVLFFVIIIMLIVSYLLNLFAKKCLFILSQKLTSISTNKWARIIVQYKSIDKLSHLAPGLVFYIFANTMQRDRDLFISESSDLIRILSILYIYWVVALFLFSLLNSINAIYNQYEVSKKLPIKNYIQLIKFLLAALIIIVSISTILGISPLAFFAGLGVTTGFVLVVFKDGLLNFLASSQLSMYDIVRIGDCINVPEYTADGEVIEISLNTVQVKNFDMTITSIPTSAMLRTGIRNYRGVLEAGGRRIQRALNIDIKTIRFLTNEELEKFKNIKHIAECIPQIFPDNKILPNCNNMINNSGLTNIGLFRNYIKEYLNQNPNIHKKDFSFLVRELQPTEKGLPIELYIFTNAAAWEDHELIQADIFDHLFAISSCFDLKIYQDRN